MGLGRQLGLNARAVFATGNQKKETNEGHKNARVSNLCLNIMIATCTT